MMKELETNYKHRLIMREDLHETQRFVLENLHEAFASDRNAFDILYIIHTVMKIIKTDSCAASSYRQGHREHLAMRARITRYWNL